MGWQNLGDEQRGPLCSNCGEWISDRNKSGLCNECKKEEDGKHRLKKKLLACPYCQSQEIQKNYKKDYIFKMCKKCKKKAEIF